MEIKYRDTKDFLACGFFVTEHLGAEEMTEQYFAEYNKNTPTHPLAASIEVDYLFDLKNKPM